jgi:hypothetical protein
MVLEEDRFLLSALTDKVIVAGCRQLQVSIETTAWLSLSTSKDWFFSEKKNNQFCWREVWLTRIRLRSPM